MAKWIAGWIGAWLGSPVFGHWWLRIQDTYLIPALVGAFIGAFSVVFLVKMFGGATLERPAAVGAVAPQILETRKAS